MVSRPVEVGRQTKSRLLQRLRELSVRMNESARRLLFDGRLTTTETRHILPTGEPTVDNLGYRRGVPGEETRARFCRLGPDACPLELGPHPPFAYLGQPVGSFGAPARQHRAPFRSVTVLSKPLDGDPGAPRGLCLRQMDGVPWLPGYRSERTFVWAPVAISCTLDPRIPRRRWSNPNPAEPAPNPHRERR